MKYSKPVLCKTVSRGKDDWYVYVDYTDDSGRRTRIKKRGGLNYIESKRTRLIEAKTLIQEWDRLIKQGWTHDRSEVNTVPLKKILYEFLEIKRGTIKHRSYQSYKYTLDTFFNWLNDEYMLPQYFTKQLAFNYSDYLLVGRKYSGKTFNSEKSNLNIFFNMLLDREIIEKNPFKKVAKRPEIEGRHIVYTEDQRKRIKKYLLDEKPNQGLYDFIECIYQTLRRPKHILEIKLQDIDIEKRAIMIGGKNRKQIPVCISDTYVEKIEGIILLMKAGVYKPTDYLFSKGLRPGPVAIHRNQVTAKHRKMLNDINKIDNNDTFKPEHTLYSWKHTSASNAKNDGISNQGLMKQFGHLHESQTDIYTRSIRHVVNTEYMKKKSAF